MPLRLDYRTAAPDANRALAQLSKSVARRGLGTRLLQLVYLRVSQINGCAYCVDLHFQQALTAGEDARRVNGVAAWREMPFYSERERAALAWAESLTRIEQTGAPDEDFDLVRDHFEDGELADLTFAIGEMNAWNRVAIGFRRAPLA